MSFIIIGIEAVFNIISQNSLLQFGLYSSLPPDTIEYLLGLLETPAGLYWIIAVTCGFKLK